MNSLIDHFTFQNVLIEKLQDLDIDETVSLINPAYSYQDKVKGESRINPEKLRKRAAETDFYILKQHGKIIACVYLEPKGSGLHFGLLTVAPEYRGTGLGPAIMQAIDDYAREQKFDEIDLDYMSLAYWLEGYYERFGFKATGEITPWGNIDLVRMVKLLN